MIIYFKFIITIRDNEISFRELISTLTPNYIEMIIPILYKVVIIITIFYI